MDFVLEDAVLIKNNEEHRRASVEKKCVGLRDFADVERYLTTLTSPTTRYPGHIFIISYPAIFSLPRGREKIDHHTEGVLHSLKV